MYINVCIGIYECVCMCVSLLVNYIYSLGQVESCASKERSVTWKILLKS